MVRVLRYISVVLAALVVAGSTVGTASAAAPVRYTLTVVLAGSGGGAVSSTPGGISCGTGCSANFRAGTAVTLTATPDANSTFAGWSGGGCSGTGTCAVTMNSDLTVTATFDPILQPLTVTKAGSGGGTVTSSPAGINCGATCTAMFNQGSTVTLTATPDSNSTFAGWSGACAGTGTCLVTMTSAQSVTATFAPITHVLTVTKAGTGGGSVTSSPAGIDCGATCSASFNQGTSVTLTATPDANSTFTGWSGSGCSGTGTCQVTMGGDRSVTATFTLKTYTLTVAKTGTGGGTVTSSPAGIDCGATCSATYDALTVVTLTATPDADSTFAGWSGAGCSGTGTCQVTLTGSTTVSAAFAPITHTVTVTKSGTGGGSVTSSPAGIDCGATCSASFNQGTVVTLTATPDANSTFAGWSGACTGGGTCQFTVGSDLSVTATFTAITHLVSVTKSGTGGGSVTSSPAGIDCGATCSAPFNQGTVVTLTATPDANSTFAGWSGAGCSGTGTCQFTVGGPVTVTATFTAITHTVTVNRSGTGSGSVTSSPAGINCGATCSADFNQGSTVTLTATPAADSDFTGWNGGGCSGTGTCQISVSSDTTVTATFTLKTYQLSVVTAGTGGGTVTSSPVGIDCGVTCADTFDSGTVVTLTATPDANSTFTGWSGVCSGTGTCQVTMDGAKSVTATFTIIPHQISVTLAGNGVGTVTSVPSGINCGLTCTATFNQGSTVTLSATPDVSSGFSGWSGGGCSGVGSCQFTVSSDVTITATFTLKTFQLSVADSGTGSGAITGSPGSIDCGATCTDTFDYGTIVTLTPTPAADSTFNGWTGDCSGTGACQVTMDGAKSVTATFTLKRFLLAVTLDGTGLGSVASQPAGVDCGATCSALFDAGTAVTLTATPDANSTFGGWGGACSGTGDCLVSMDDVQSVTATFDIIQHEVSVATTGAGSGSITSSPAGLDCGTTCSNAFDQGMSVTLTATADTGSVFTGWSGDCSGTGDCVLPVDADHNASANFSGPRQPDGLIKLSTASSYKGSGVYNLTGAKQTQSAGIKPATQKAFLIQVRNAGVQADTFTILAGGNQSPFTITYSFNGTNVTKQVVAGTFRTPSLWSGEGATIKAVVKAKKQAKKSASASWLVTATSTGLGTARDAVMITANVK